jgi:hypothetical protein
MITMLMELPMEFSFANLNKLKPNSFLFPPIYSSSFYLKTTTPLSQLISKFVRPLHKSRSQPVNVELHLLIVSAFLS